MLRIQRKSTTAFQHSSLRFDCILSSKNRNINQVVIKSENLDVELIVDHIYLECDLHLGFCFFSHACLWSQVRPLVTGTKLTRTELREIFRSHEGFFEPGLTEAQKIALVYKMAETIRTAFVPRQLVRSDS